MPTDAVPTGDVPTGDKPSAVPAEGVPARPSLTVLNHSRITGLAKRAADEFRDGGWEVVEVGNTRREILETTVFYLPGQEPAAAALRAQFPRIRASAVRPEGLPGSGLTVVVTRDYQ